jgi:hypothetical protein
MRGMVSLALFGCCLSCSQRGKEFRQADEPMIDSSHAVMRAVLVVQTGTRNSSALAATSFRHDTAGFDITLSPRAAPGTVVLGGGGRVRLDPHGHVIEAELYQ